MLTCAFYDRLRSDCVPAIRVLAACRPHALHAAAHGSQLLRWVGPNVTPDLLVPHSVQRSWVVRYKVLRGRVFVHAEDRGFVLYNPSCSACVPKMW